MSETKTEQAKRLLVRYIRDHHLMCGDKLPPRDYFRNELKFGSLTIATALHELQNDGVVHIKDKVGVYILDPEADGHSARMIGLTAYSDHFSAYYGCLLCHLQLEFARFGCGTRIFCAKPSFDQHVFQISDFPGLKRCVETRVLSGIIHLDDFSAETIQYLKNQKIPVAFVGNYSHNGDGVCIDEPWLIRDAVMRLHAIGCRRTALLYPVGMRLPEMVEFMDNLMDECDIADQDRWHSVSSDDAIKLAMRFVALPVAERPDGIIVLDDTFALPFFNYLALNVSPDAMPKAAILYNNCSNLSFPLYSPLLYCNELDQFVRMAVKFMLDKIITPNNPPTSRQLYQPILKKEQF